MQPSLVQTKASVGLIEGLKKILDQTPLIKDHLPKVLIHPLQELQGLEITVQDLMINQKIIIY